jgi:chemotaxis family two-component system response regulator Rcp1
MQNLQHLGACRPAHKAIEPRPQRRPAQRRRATWRRRWPLASGLLEALFDLDDQTLGPDTRGLHLVTPVNKPLRVLLAEDNPADVMVIREALVSHFGDVEISVQQDGEQMIHMIELLDRGEAPCPDVILLDFNLPRITGDVALERWSHSRLSGQIPVVVVSSSDAPRDREAATRLGASSYFRKPNDYDEYMKLGDLVGDILAA